MQNRNYLQDITLSAKNRERGYKQQLKKKIITIKAILKDSLRNTINFFFVFLATD